MGKVSRPHQRNRDLFQKSYDSVEMTNEEVECLQKYPHTTYVLGIGEEWCPDVFGNLPVVARIASYNPEKILLRIFATHSKTASRRRTPTCRDLRIQHASRTMI